MSNEDFIKAISNWNDFLDYPISEDSNSDMGYPVGISLDGIKIYFQHYRTFDEAIEKWVTRKKRLNNSQIVFMLTNYCGDSEIVREFNDLEVENKIVFTDQSFETCDSAVKLKHWKPNSGRNIWATSSIIGNRYIDSWDIISYLNNLNRK